MVDRSRDRVIARGLFGMAGAGIVLFVQRIEQQRSGHFRSQNSILTNVAY